MLTREIRLAKSILESKGYIVSKRLSEASIEDACRDINSNYKQGASIYDKDGYNNNCVQCALAFEATMRGEHVQAKPFRFGMPEDIDKSKSYYRAFNLSYGDTWSVGNSKRAFVIKSIEDLMQDFGPASRAILQIESAHERHTMNVISQNGVIQIVDAQNGTHGSVSKMLKGLPTKNVSMIQVDDKSINSEYSNWAYTKIDPQKGI